MKRIPAITEREILILMIVGITIAILIGYFTWVKCSSPFSFRAGFQLGPRFIIKEFQFHKEGGVKAQAIAEAEK